MSIEEEWRDGREIYIGTRIGISAGVAMLHCAGSYIQFSYSVSCAFHTFVSGKKMWQLDSVILGEWGDKRLAKAG